MASTPRSATPLPPVPLITVDEARMLGLRVHTAAFHRVRPGIHIARSVWDSLAGWQRYEVRVRAFVLAHPDAVLCLESAAAVHGLPLFGQARDIHVYDRERAASRRFGDVAVHTSEDVREVQSVDGIATTSVLDTVVDLARVLPPAYALAVADASVSPAWAGGSLDVDALRARASEQRMRRGRARLELLWPVIDARSESPGESVSRAVILWSGFEEPELQREFRYEGVRDRVDFHFPSVRAIGESDGWGKYGLDDAALAQQRLRDEKRREDRLRRHGHSFARWDYADALRVEPLRLALVRAGVPVVRRPRPALLATLRGNPRSLPAGQ
ncbi:hypothetical protein [uncultured Microbacterium sp.]|nr:hypothetical protein [uncultured Microbacterium sp.]